MVRGRTHDRLLNGVDDRIPDDAAVEALRAEVRDALVRLRKRRVREHRADVPWRSVRVEEERGARRDVVEPVAVRVHLVEPDLVDEVAVARDVDRRLEGLVQRHRPELLERLLPGLDRAGHADREPAVAGVVEGQRRPFSQNEVGCIAAGAVSRPSIVVTSPPAVRMTMKPPPPMPHENGSVTRGRPPRRPRRLWRSRRVAECRSPPASRGSRPMRPRRPTRSRWVGRNRSRRVQPLVCHRRVPLPRRVRRANP